MPSSKTLSKAKTLASIVSIITVAATLVSSTALRQVIRSLFAPKEHPFRFATLLVALFLNAKSLPLIWHLRFAKAMVTQIYLTKPLPRDALFRPIVTNGMYTPTNETDYNGHKSNSTYFADLDIARTQHISALLSHGIRNAAKGTHTPLALKGDIPDAALQTTANGNGAPVERFAAPNKGAKVVFGIALGAVSCHFKREIKPYERFDIWTRVLSWDQKWIYQVTHMVRQGAIPPDHCALQPWKTPAGQPSKYDMESEEQRAKFMDAVFATSISKYVVKRGRQTVPPELVFQSSNLLPPMPGQGPNANSKKHISGVSIPDGWTWEGVEAERVRGMKLAEHFAALDGPGGLHAEFPVSQLESNNGLEVLGEFQDVFL